MSEFRPLGLGSCLIARLLGRKTSSSSKPCRRVCWRQPLPGNNIASSASVFIFQLAFGPAHSIQPVAAYATHSGDTWYKHCHWVDVVERREAVIIWLLAASYLDSCAMTYAAISNVRKAAPRRTPGKRLYQSQDAGRTPIVTKTCSALGHCTLPSLLHRK